MVEKAKTAGEAYKNDKAAEEVFRHKPCLKILDADDWRVREAFQKYYDKANKKDGGATQNEGGAPQRAPDPKWAFNSNLLHKVTRPEFDLLDAVREAAGAADFEGGVRKITDTWHSNRDFADKVGYAMACRFYEKQGFMGSIDENRGLVRNIRDEIVKRILEG